MHPLRALPMHEEDPATMNPPLSDDASTVSAQDYALMYFLSVLLFPVVIFGSWMVVHPNTECIILLFGKYRKTVSAGIHFVNIIGRSNLYVSKRVCTIRHHHVNLVDITGAAIECSAVLTYQICNSAIAVLKIDDCHDYISNTSLTTLKTVAGRYPFASDNPEEDTLQSDSKLVSDEMKRELKVKAIAIGVRVLSFELVDLQYDESIAKSMSVKQTSRALLSARKIIVKGAAEIVGNTIRSLRAQGINFSDGERSKLVSNLLAVICSSSNAQGSNESSRQEKPDYSEITMRLDDAMMEIRKLPSAIATAQVSR
ncbi:hypothetical protein GEMRC1_013915 [Eukaryota sp. GEM-RC1]